MKYCQKALVFEPK